MPGGMPNGMIEFAIAEFARRAFGGSALEVANRDVISNAVDSIAEFAERSYGRVQPEGNGREPIACKPGCNYCCHMRVVASVPEVIALAEFIAANFPAGAIEALRRRVAKTDMKT